jgi:endoglycosylceramidase
MNTLSRTARPLILLVPLLLPGCGAGGEADADAVPDATKGPDDAVQEAGPDVPTDAGPDTTAGWTTVFEGGRYFVKDELGRTAILRGVGMGGGSKMPPFLPVEPGDDKPFAQLQGWGVDAVRLALPWEAVEPEPGLYDGAYLDAVAKVADSAASHGIVVVLDMHQDFYSRCFGGDGSPTWAAPPDLIAPAGDCMYLPMNPDGAAKAWAHFWTDDWRPDDRSLQDHYEGAWMTVVARFRDYPAVVGYDLYNEPYQLSGLEGFEEFAEMETGYLMPFYQRLATSIRADDPDALFFIEPTIQVFSDFENVFHTDTKLAALDAGGTVLAPHFYDIGQLIMQCGATFDRLTTKADSDLAAFDAAGRDRIGAPVVIGEYGSNQCKAGAAEDVMHQLAVHEALMLGSFFWNYWVTGETWMMTGPGEGGEDMSLVTPEIFATEQYPAGTPRCIVRQFVRPYPMRVAGVLEGYRYDLSFADYQGIASDWLFDDKDHPFTNTRSFTLRFAESGVKADTLVFIPRAMAFGSNPVVKVSDGEWAWSATLPDVLVWTTDPSTSSHVMTVKPSGEPPQDPLPLCDPGTR